MSAIQESDVSSVMKRNAEINHIGQRLCELSHDINRSDMTAHKTDYQKAKLNAKIEEYWSTFDEYQKEVVQINSEFGVSKDGFPYYNNPHLAVLQASEE